MTEMLRVLSLGAGVQSSVIALMSARGELPRLDCAIFADTGWEPKAVYEWLDWLETQLPYPVYRVRRPGLDLGAISMAVASGEVARKGSSLPPWYVRMDEGGTILKVDEDGFENEYVIPEKGMLPKHCSKEFKTRVVARKLREMIGLEPGQRGPKEVAVEQWMGISQDEMQRMKSAEQPWVRNVFPLIEKRMRRYDCLRWMELRQYPRPPKSSCIFCLAGETEVVTRGGIRRIAELAGSDHELLVPNSGTLGGLACIGSFQSVPVRSFGVQPLLAIDLRRGRQRKILHATAEHAWVLESRRVGESAEAYRKTTSSLQVGDELKSLRVMPLREETASWVVEAVRPTDRVEEVFCATVPGVEAFGLADDLMTGNCPYRGNAQWRDMRDNAPEDWARAVAFDEAIRPGFADMHGSAYVHRHHVPLADADLSPSNSDQFDMFDEECDGVCGV